MEDKFEHTSAPTRQLTLEFLQQITDNFSEAHVIGRGGYGVVYKGLLENGEEIALKKLHYIPGSFDETRYRNEFNNLMRSQHSNITRLVGYCYSRDHKLVLHEGEYVFAHVEERILCFEYLQRGSLDKYISDESCGLDWHTRLNIIKGVCEGLNYLHNGRKDHIYHLDLKPANILLDNNMVPKIGDFGLSRLFPSTQTYITIKIIGTPGYMPPEYIKRYKITSKYDVFSLGVIIIRIMAGHEGYDKCAQMPSQEFINHVHENWGKRLQATMSLRTSEQVKTCIEIALRCVEVNRENRPTIAEIVVELSKLTEPGSRIVFSSTYKPPVPLDIFSHDISASSGDSEVHLTDGVSHNYNGSSIPPAALKILLKSPKLAEEGGATNADIDAGQVSGLVFVSERGDGLETLYIALRFNADNKVKVFPLADIFGAANFSGARMEDSGCFGGGYRVWFRTIDHCLVYVSTKEPVQERGTPWTVVYKTSLRTGKTERLTPQGVFDLSPAVSPSGKAVAVASFQNKRWNGEVEDLRTDIYVMNVDSEEGLGRKLPIKNGGWPSWGSNNIIFFHRAEHMLRRTEYAQSRTAESDWGVYKYNISTKETVRVTPEGLDAVTPAAINETKVAVATIRQKSKYGDVREMAQYRHIEIFDADAGGLGTVQITQKTRPLSDHYNPFVLDSGKRIGYYRWRSDLLQLGDLIPQNLHKLDSPVKDVDLFRVSGVFPAISKDGSKLAFIDKEFKAVWVADSQGLRIVYKTKGPSSIFSPAWNQNPDKDTLYVCIGASFNAAMPVDIYAIRNVSCPAAEISVQRLTSGGFNHSFPSSSPNGSKFVFQSTREVGEKYKNLYIMVDTPKRRVVTRLTNGAWIDTQCQWSPNGPWIVFSSTRDRPHKDFFGPEESSGYFSVYLVNASDPTVVIRVMDSSNQYDYGGYINHPVFSPDGRSIAVTADLAAVSVDPISLPNCVHAVRPYGDIFMVVIDPFDLEKNKDVKQFRRITHSRYECGTPALARTFAASATEPDAPAPWNMLLDVEDPYQPVCPYVHHHGGESWHMTGHLLIPERDC